MTEPRDTDRCRWCRRLNPAPARTGRPRRYCSASCRQRAYEARRRAVRSGLPAGVVPVRRVDLDRLHDRLYALEAALDDVEADLTGSRRVPSSQAYRHAFEHLHTAALDLRSMVVEPAPV